MNKSEKYFLKTSRLGFRQWREDDLSNAIGLWGDYEVTKYFDARGKLSHDEVQERLDGILSDLSLGSIFQIYSLLFSQKN